MEEYRYQESPAFNTGQCPAEQCRPAPSPTEDNYRGCFRKHPGRYTESSSARDPPNSSHGSPRTHSYRRSSKRSRSATAILTTIQEGRNSTQDCPLPGSVSARPPLSCRLPALSGPDFAWLGENNDIARRHQSGPYPCHAASCGCAHFTPWCASRSTGWLFCSGPSLFRNSGAWGSAKG